MRPEIVPVASFSLLASGVGVCGMLALNRDSVKCTTLTGLAGGLCIFLGFVLLDVCRLRPSKKHTASSLFQQYALEKIIIVSGKYARWKLLRSCRDCQKQQASLLQQILNQNKDTVFAQDHGLTAIRTVEDFRNHMPLTGYSHYEKYVEMITAGGKTNVMFPCSVDYVAMTSGTSKGKSKGYPKSKIFRDSNFVPWLILAAYQMQSLPGLIYLKRMYSVQPAVKTKRTPSGIEQGPISYFVSGHYTPSFCVVPPCPADKEETCLYVHVLCGLLEEDITNMQMLTTVTTLALFKTLEVNWERLCDDVEQGQLSSSLQIDQDFRQELNKRLHKNPARARLLRSEFRNGFEDIVRRIWPHCRYIFAIRTGSFETQARLLREKYIGDIPILTILHTGTEALYGLNMDPLDEHVRYTLVLGTCFFEFIPEGDMDNETPATLLAHQVEVGRCYEMVVTTLDGLYRYRTEDIVQITSYRDTAPVYKFIRRAGDILSANMEKVPEVLLYEAVTTAARGWNNTTIVDFTSVENVRVESITGDVSGASFYIVFLEMGDGDHVTMEEKAQVSAELLSRHEVYAAMRVSELRPVKVEQADAKLQSRHEVYAAMRVSEKLRPVKVEQVDTELQSRHEVYAAMRASGKLSPVKVEQVRPGTYEKVKAWMLQSNTDAFFMQYKLPRIVRRTDVLKLLLEQIYPSET